MPYDRFRDGVAIPLPDVAVSALRTKDGRDLKAPPTNWRFADNFYAALYLQHLELGRLTQFRPRFEVVLSPGASRSLFALKAGDTLLWGVSADRQQPLSFTATLTGQSLPMLWVHSVARDPQDGVPIRAVVSPLTADPFSPNLAMGVPPGHSGTLLLDQTGGRYQWRIQPPQAAAITAFVDELQDGTWINGFEATWTNAYGSQGTQWRLTDTTDSTNVLEYSAGQGQRRLRHLDIADGTYKAECRHEFPPQQSSLAPQYSQWIEVESALVLEQDETAPAAPKNVKATRSPGGLQVEFTARQKRITLYEIHLLRRCDLRVSKFSQSQANSSSGKSGAQTLQVQHVDRSGNESAITSVQVTLTKDGHEEQWIFPALENGPGLFFPRPRPPTPSATMTTTYRRVGRGINCPAVSLSLRVRHVAHAPSDREPLVRIRSDVDENRRAGPGR